MSVIPSTDEKYRSLSIGVLIKTIKGKTDLSKKFLNTSDLLTHASF